MTVGIFFFIIFSSSSSKFNLKVLSCCQSSLAIYHRIVFFYLFAVILFKYSNGLFKDHEDIISRNSVNKFHEYSCVYYYIVKIPYNYTMKCWQNKITLNGNSIYVNIFWFFKKPWKMKRKIYSAIIQHNYLRIYDLSLVASLHFFYLPKQLKSFSSMLFIFLEKQCKWF